MADVSSIRLLSSLYVKYHLSLALADRVIPATFSTLLACWHVGMCQRQVSTDLIEYFMCSAHNVLARETGTLTAEFSKGRDTGDTE